MNGKFQAKSTSKALAINKLALEVLILSIVGLFAVVLRAKLRIPLSMSGHHGLEVMALLLIGRSVSKLSMASSISTLAAALLIFFPFMGFKDPFLPIIYLLMGANIDFMYQKLKQSKLQLFIFVLIGALSYSIIPSSRILIHISTGYPYESLLKAGYAYTVFSHFIFGALGGLLAFGLVYTTKKIRN
ncbi:MAG: hypothetical protein JW729_03880 [Bacteroidales bacterium]|nr:hypothetical protein [Bacteroidales bacterium]